MQTSCVHLLVAATLTCATPALEAAGTVVQGTLESAALGVTKEYNIYLPESYAENNLRYPVIYLVHGWGVGEDEWTSPALQVQAVADAMELQALIVMPDGGRGVFVNSLTPPDYNACMNSTPPVRNASEPRASHCVRSANYEDYMLADIIPHVDATYRTLPRRKARGIIGESAGGLAAMLLALRNKELFSFAASHAGALALLYNTWEERMLTTIEPRGQGFDEWEAMFGFDIANWRAHDPYSLLDTLKPGELALYFDCGDEDEAGFHPMALQFERRLNELGLPHTFVSVPGGKHDNSFFASRIPVSLYHIAAHFRSSGTSPPPP